jgi:hypothetical protein
LQKSVEALIASGIEPHQVMRAALSGLPHSPEMQNGVPMILSKAIVGALAACQDFEFRSEEEIQEEKEWAEEGYERIE